ncbi:GntR family transcriptional regulator/MocR family aminotransferase [Kribbella sp. VKM Ac-2571]|uniref:MocR-like pyridoxine biosynthesis transcription factor PdxR n=1 Tax=Kribbella sp. VKM Ac-2571 TaxID=2512222 RepID=UPI00105C9BA8|nr:PLP-dependent aminotransferase family protein [Kribbella sp. VKM Ac-2571]TDO55068.1 GntR family transcriptional regulator/MocR family aminotransferase [Kribbella sp. VKM Ac-2571]
MAKQSTRAAWTVVLTLDGDGKLHRQVERALREAIRSGRVSTGTVLPPSRELAAQLDCSRWAVTQAYSQLVTEGYLATRVGSGTWVSWSGPTRRTARRTVAGGVATYRFDLAPGAPDLRAFPRTRWAEAARAAARTVPTADLGYPDEQGYLPLRELMSDYLQRSRGAIASAADVVIRSGVSASVAQLCTGLRAMGISRIAVEDPGWTRLRTVIESTGMRLEAVPVDQHGLQVERLSRRDDLRAVIVTAAHQFPTGVVLAPHRRLGLIDWARRNNGVILEDDYDAEFRYDRSPAGTLQGMAPEHVVLLGSVSKTLSPAIGIGWLVAQGEWRSLLDHSSVPGPSTINQATFAELVAAGAYDRHLRTMQRRYKRRRDCVLTALQHELPTWTVGGAAAGLHLTLTHPSNPGTRLLTTAARDLGIRIVPLLDYRIRTAGTQDGIVLGYGNLTDNDVAPAIRSLAKAFANSRHRAAQPPS